MSEQGRLHQINATYQPDEDRILLRMNTTTGAEYRCWLTRRYVALLWQVTLQLAERLSSAGLAAPNAADPALRAEVTRFAHAPLTDGIDTKTGFADGTRFPLGAEPLLLTRITPRVLGPGRYQLRLEPAKGEGIDIGVDERLAHTFLRILGNAVQPTDWGLDLKIARNPAVPAVLPTGHLH